MKQNRITGLLLVAVSALTLGYCGTGGVDAFGIFATFMAFIGAFSNVNIKMRPSRKAITLLVIALLFAVYYRSTHQGSYSDGPATREQWQMLSRYFITVSIFYLFVNRRENLPPTIIVFLSVSILISPQVMRELDFQAIMCAMLYVVATAFFCYSSQRIHVSRFSGLRPKIALFFAILAISVFSGYFGGTKLADYNEDISRYLLSIHPAPQLFTGNTDGRPRDEVDLSDMSGLDSIMLARQANSRNTIIRIFSEKSPGYLRSKSYDDWDGSKWTSDPTEEPVAGSILPLESGYPAWPYEKRANDNIFQLKAAGEPSEPESTDPAGYNFYDIWPSPSHDWIYLPLNCRYLQIPANNLTLSDSQMVESATDRTSGANYQVAVPIEPLSTQQSSKQQLARYLKLPENWQDWQMAYLTTSIIDRKQNNSEKIHAIQNYFLSNYKYTLAPDFPADVKNHMKYFLLNKIDSYCEYFASGTVLLLRAAGVPARYVVGYYVSERDTITECWVARRRDAHAWAEAWNAELGRWEIVESTPGDGIPQAGSDVSLFGNYYDYFMYKIQELKVTLGEGGLTGLRMWLSDMFYNIIQKLFTTVPGYIILAFLGALTILRYNTRLKASRNRPALSVRVKMLNRQLATMDRRMNRIGLRRSGDETIRQFACRIEESVNFKKPEKKALAVQWYLDYEKKRYFGV